MTDTGPDPSRSLSALLVRAPSKKALTPAAKAFNHALERIRKLQGQIEELDRMGSAHQAKLAESLRSLHEQYSAAMQALLASLKSWLTEQRRILMRHERQRSRQARMTFDDDIPW